MRETGHALRIATVALALVLGACSRDQKPVRVVLITLDTLRADRFTDATMPLVRARAARGLVFQQFYAATSSTQPTHATLLTGLEPWQHGVALNGAVLEDARETLAERLKAEGFATCAVVASFPLEHRFGFAQGFDRYDDAFEHVQGTAAKPMHVWAGAEVGEGEFYSLSDTITTKAIAAIDSASTPRQFYWFHYFDAHAPYGDTEGAGIALTDLTSEATQHGSGFDELLARSKAGYDADVRHLDRALDRLLARLDQDRDRFETHIFVTADHGESFGEDGCLGHGKHLIRSQVHVPAFVLSPRIGPAVRDDVAGSIDVMPTLLALTGVGGAQRCAGRDLAAPPPSELRPALGMRRTFPKPFKDVRIDGTIVLVQGPQFYLARAGRLYIGDGQRVESEDPAPDPAFLANVRAIFAACEVELASSAGREDLHPETQRALEALGYTR